jgi:hypothetical protein
LGYEYAWLGTEFDFLGLLDFGEYYYCEGLW